jgi:hypothetical protein
MNRLSDTFDSDTGYHGDRADWYLVVSQTRDSDCLALANFIDAQELLAEYPDSVAVERMGHWAVGWVEHLLVAPNCLSAYNVAADITASLGDYPILCEETYSRLLDERMLEDWESYGWYDLANHIEKQTGLELSAKVSHEHLELGEYWVESNGFQIERMYSKRVIGNADFCKGFVQAYLADNPLCLDDALSVAMKIESALQVATPAFNTVSRLPQFLHEEKA